MKEKILKAIDKGLMNVFSTDITDHDIEFDHDNINSEYNRYEYRTVDMGTGILWCEYNLGAFPGNNPSDWYGDYYAWSEIETKDNYSWKTYKYWYENMITKYNKKDGLTRLEPNDDVITLTLGEKFRMPTKEEYQKLIKNTTNKWIKNYKGIYGLNGRLFTAENGNTLFFPATGYYDYSDLHDPGVYGNLWSASRYSYDSSYAFFLNFGSSNVIPNDGDCLYYGFTVRGIQTK